MLELIEYAYQHALRFTAGQIDQWGIVGVAMTNADLFPPVENDYIEQETWHTAWNGM